MPLVLGAILGAGCALQRGTGGTAIEVDNTCSVPLLLRLTGERWDRSVEDQLEGTPAEPGETVRETAVHPPNDDEQLVLRISSPEGDPLMVVPVVRDSIERLELDASACEAIGSDIICSAPAVGDEATVSCP